MTKYNESILKDQLLCLMLKKIIVFNSTLIDFLESNV